MTQCRVPCVGSRSNMLGTQFTVYDSGISPKGHNVSENKLRREMVAIAYVSCCTV